MSAAGQTDALCQQPSQLHHDQGKTNHGADIFTADVVGTARVLLITLKIQDTAPQGNTVITRLMMN